MNKLRVASWLVLLISLATKQGFTQPISHEQVINKAYENWVNVTNAKDIEQWATYLAPDAIFHPPNHSALIGNKAIIDFYLELFADKRFSLKCIQDKIEISESEDLAWSMGSCEATFTGLDGKEAKDKSKWVKVWIRLSNGDWKCKISSWSSILKK